VKKQSTISGTWLALFSEQFHRTIPFLLITVVALMSTRTPIRAETIRKFTRPAMIESMTTNCVVAGLMELTESAKQLSHATHDLQQNPSTNSLVGAQNAWIGLQLAFKRNAMLTRGPSATSWTMQFFPERLPTAIENVIRSPRPINADFIEILGAPAKGSYTLEYLLFDSAFGMAIVGATNATPRLSAKMLLEGLTSERRRLYVRELARDIEMRLRPSVEEAQSPGFIPKFVAGDQDSVNLLVNQVIQCIESEILQRFHIYTNHLQGARLRYDMIDGAISGTSLPAFKAALEGARRYYRGGENMGLDDYVRSVNPTLAARMEDQFDAAAQSLEALKPPFPDALLHRRAEVQKFVDETRELEQLFKVDVISALGATLMFGSNDGD
jgi:predicted lipoprotein